MSEGTPAHPGRQRKAEKNTEILDEINSFRKKSLSIFFVRLSKFDSKLAAAIKNTFWNPGPSTVGLATGLTSIPHSIDAHVCLQKSNNTNQSF